jgi:hypothetical protein
MSPLRSHSRQKACATSSAWGERSWFFNDKRVVDLKEQLIRLKKSKPDQATLDALVAQVREKEKAARDLESKAAQIDAAVYDLKAVNPNVVANVDDRTVGTWKRV